MSKPFDYSKWDKIELSDDEDDCHPNIDKESWFRMKHRSRVEREEHEAKDIERIQKEQHTNQQRIKIIQHDLTKIENKLQKEDNDQDEVEDLKEERESLLVELRELESSNAHLEQRLKQYEKNKKWNVDNMFEVKEERTIVNPKAATPNYTPSGFVQPTEDLVAPPAASSTTKEIEQKVKAATISEKPPAKTTNPTSTTTTTQPAPIVATTAPTVPSPQESVSVGSFETYHQFTQKYADTVELFMKLPTLRESKDFLLQHATILLQENASNYLLLASLEDEMNGEREKMKRTARQSQIISSIAELAKSLETHPGNVIQPFFQRLEQREYLEEFMGQVNVFVQKIIQRAVVKKREIDQERGVAQKEGRDLQDIPLEERLGPGGLDPLEVIDTLPPEMVQAFESRDVDALKEALMKMSNEDAEYHMKRCVDSGLWQMNG